MPGVMLKDRATLKTREVPADKIVIIQNISGGHLDIPQLKNDKDDPTITLEKDEVLDLRDYELTPAAMKRGAGGLRWAHEQGKILILAIENEKGEAVQIATPRGTPKKYDKKTHRSFIGDEVKDPKGHFDEARKLLSLREQRENLESRQGVEPTEAEEKILSGEAEEELAEKLKESEKTVTGDRGPQQDVRISGASQAGETLQGVNSKDMDEQDRSVAGKNTATTTPRKR